MSESKKEKLPQSSSSSSSAIKLFGKTISLLSPSLVNQQRQQESRVFADDDDDHHYHSYASKDGKAPLEEEDKEYSEAELIVNSINLGTSPIGEEPKTPSTEREASSLKFSKNGEGEQIDQSSSSSSQEKPLKKPDKILPCPRCNSMDTKFCYYNNYNVSQPRHFCRNCQRYWTAGGNMRNVPVGAGRRKTKNSASASSNYRQIMVPFIGNNRHITFGSDPHHSGTVPFSISRNDWSRGLSVAEQRRDYDSASGLARPCNSLTSPPVLSPSGFPVQLPTETAYSSYALPGQYLNTMNVSPKILGKHSREGYIICPSNLAGSNRDNDRSAERGIFHGFQLMKGPDDRNPYVADTSATVLQANPAAFSRSLNFRESS